MEMTKENLSKIYNAFKDQKGFNFYHLVELFGDIIWEWDVHFDHQETLNLEFNEKRLLLKALKISKYRQAKAAELLGITPRAVNYLVKKYGIKHERWRVNKKEVNDG